MTTDHAPNEQNDTLKSFLQEEIEHTRKRLEDLKGKIKEEDYNSLDAELNMKSGILDSVEEGDIQLFLLRREIGMLRENLEELTVKQGWWSRLPVSARIAIITLPVLLYFIWMAVIQLSHPKEIYSYPATQTAMATQTTGAVPAAVTGAAETLMPTPTANP